MTTDTSPPQGSKSTIQRQHDMLNSLIDAIANRFRHDHSPSRNLVSLLNALAFHLQTHFEFEESDGYFTSLVEKAPRAAQTVERILREHREMLKEIEEMISTARKDLDEKRSTDALAERYERFREKLEEHEHLENELLQSVYTEDIGTKD